MLLHLRVLGISGSLYFKYENALFKGEQENEYYFCENGIEKSVPRDHHLSSLGKPCDSKRRSSRQIFLFRPHTHDRFFYKPLLQ